MKLTCCGIIAFLVAMPVVSVQAQEPYAGILGGLHFADARLVLENDPTSNHDFRVRTLFGVGGFIGLSLNEYTAFQIEPMFIQKGGVYTSSTSPDMKVKSSQLELHALLKAGIGEQVRPYIFAGPFVSFLLDANATLDLAGHRFEGDLMKILKRTEYGAVFGSGVSVSVWKGSAFIEGRYGLGLTNLNKGGRVDLISSNLIVALDTVPGDELTVMGFQIMAGYQLPLGGD
jgi:hypothetical protein